MEQVDLGLKLKKNADEIPDKLAIVWKDKQVTYKELNDRASKLANALLSLQLKPRDHVAVLLRNTPNYVEVICGLIKAGMVHVPINWRFAGPEVEYVLDNSSTKAVILSEDFLDKVESSRENLKNLPKDNYIFMGDNPPAGMKKYDDLVANAKNTEPNIGNSAKDPYFIGYTSGTTGRPKGAVTRHGSWEIKTAGLPLLLRLNLDHDETQLLTMPLFHMNAINTVGLSIYLGHTVILMPGRFDGEVVLQLIQDNKVTFSSMVPTMYHRIKNLSDEVKNKYDVSSLKSLLQSSAPLPYSTKEWIVSFFNNCGLFEGYGGTEAGVITMLYPEEQLTKKNSVGRPLPTSEVKIVDEDGHEVPTGEVGQIISRPATEDTPVPPVTEYYKNADATIKSFKDGWFYGGDMGYKDEEGFIYLVDRKFDMIISGGENIYPKEIEDVLYTNSCVLDAAAVGVPDSEWGESVKVVIVLKEGEKANEAEIINYCRDSLGKYKTPRSVDFVDDLPKTATGKVIRRLVKEKYWKGQDKRI